MTLDGKNEITGLDAKVPRCTSTTAGLKVLVSSPDPTHAERVW